MGFIVNVLPETDRLKQLKIAAKELCAAVEQRLDDLGANPRLMLAQGLGVISPPAMDAAAASAFTSRRFEAERLTEVLRWANSVERFPNPLSPKVLDALPDELRQLYTSCELLLQPELDDSDSCLHANIPVIVQTVSLQPVESLALTIGDMKHS